MKLCGLLAHLLRAQPPRAAGSLLPLAPSQPPLTCSGKLITCDTAMSVTYVHIPFLFLPRSYRIGDELEVVKFDNSVSGTPSAVQAEDLPPSLTIIGSITSEGNQCHVSHM